METIKCSVCGRVLGFATKSDFKDAKLCTRCNSGLLPTREKIAHLLAIHNLAHAVTLLIGHLHAHIKEDEDVPDIDLEGLLNMVNKDAHDLTSELLEKQGWHPPHWMANAASQKEERKAKLAIVKKED